MQTREYQLPGFDHPVIVHRNDDWSGNVVVQWSDAIASNHMTELPARLLLALSFKETKAYVLDQLGHALDVVAEEVS